MRSENHKYYLFDAYIDSGADISLFTKSDCILLGHNLEKGREKLIGGVSGSLIRTYIHKIPVRLGEDEFRAEIAFAELDEVPRLLGRKNAFEHFRILFDEKIKRVYFIPRK
ncbi:MAG: hypothetical protein AB1633_06980 [Elusimicrobiota bacterium]